MERLTARSPAASALVGICAFLAPEPIPLTLFPAAAALVPGGLAEVAADLIAWRNPLADLNRTSIARADHQCLQATPGLIRRPVGLP
jgi:hypothetical protein